jgi:predicted nucleotidyltransferase
VETRPDSDIDLLVTSAPDARLSLIQFADLREELSLVFRANVDLVERAAIRNPFRRRSIRRDVTVLYAA